MKNMITLFGFLILFTSCEEKTENPENTRGIPGPEKVEAAVQSFAKQQDSLAEALKNEGYQVFSYQEGDTTYLMQQYYMVFLKTGANRSQDSTEAAALQQQHLAYLTRMAEEGYASLIGPFGDDGDIRGIAVYNTRTAAEADSLANQDPMVKAGRLEVEVHPWWTAKGGKLP
ncbi:YciI family protein [Salinimicrobium sp. GXAS 041]|uniref:YciI family protein n=1 Tax=Salinimicrobium sp. GXAS 041 TaxID=3400806 RepID=UPI003C71C9CD